MSPTPTQCRGTLTVIAEPTAYTVMCNECGTGNTGNGKLPTFYLDKLIEQGYIRQLSRLPASQDALFRFFRSRQHRSWSEMAGDLLEQFEVFTK